MLFMQTFYPFPIAINIIQCKRHNLQLSLCPECHYSCTFRSCRARLVEQPVETNVPSDVPAWAQHHTNATSGLEPADSHRAHSVHLPAEDISLQERQKKEEGSRERLEYPEQTWCTSLAEATNYSFDPFFLRN